MIQFSKELEGFGSLIAWKFSSCFMYTFCLPKCIFGIFLHWLTLGSFVSPHSFSCALSTFFSTEKSYCLEQASGIFDEAKQHLVVSSRFNFGFPAIYVSVNSSCQPQKNFLIRQKWKDISKSSKPILKSILGIFLWIIFFIVKPIFRSN